MSIENKINANQLNAQKSTGPRTPEGKAKSALNAIKHGLCAQTVIISSEKTEDFYRFSNNLTHDFAPVNQIEKNMVQRIVSLSWRLERAAKYETLVLDKILKAQFEADTQNNETNPTNVGQASPLGKNNETNPNDPQGHPEHSEGSNSKTQLSKEEIAFLQDDLLGTAVFNDFRDERLLERVRRYESQMARELNSAMDSFYKAQTIRIQRRLDDEAAHKTLAETLQRQAEIDRHRQAIQQNEANTKKLRQRRILNYPGLESFDEVKILSVTEPAAFKADVERGYDPVNLAEILMKQYEGNPELYTPEHYAQTEARLYNDRCKVTVRTY